MLRTEYQILQGNALDVLKTLESESVQCVITSPPFWSLRDYGHSDQLGLEDTPDLFVARLADIFDEVKRVLKKNGTLWLNLGDSYLSAKSDYMPPQTIAGEGKRDYLTKESGIGYPPNRRSIPGIKQKDLVGIPWMVAFELRKRGWWLRQDIIWAKPNPMPESVDDRCTKSHEYIFLLTKSKHYYFDNVSIQEEANYDGRKDTMFKGGVKYDDQPIVPGTDANTFHSQGRERWKWKNRQSGATEEQEAAYLGNAPTNLKRCGDSLKGRDRSLPQNRNGITGSLDHKNLQYDGQQPNSFHVNRADGNPDDVYAVRNKRDVWTVNTKPYKDSHFATFPEKLVEPMVLAGTKEGDLILDPFSGAATTGLVALKLGRNYLGIELNEKYIKISKKRLSAIQPKMFV